MQIYSTVLNYIEIHQILGNNVEVSEEFYEKMKLHYNLHRFKFSIFTTWSSIPHNSGKSNAGID